MSEASVRDPGPEAKDPIALLHPNGNHNAHSPVFRQFPAGSD